MLMSFVTLEVRHQKKSVLTKKLKRDWGRQLQLLEEYMEE